MKSNRTYWPIWMNYIKKLGAMDFLVWLLHDASPLAVFGAQLLYISQPFLPSSSYPGLRALADLLEDKAESEDFLAILKGSSR